MGSDSIITFLFASSLGVLGLFELKKWQRRQAAAEQLRRVGETLEQAEATLLRFQERHDRILLQIDSRYFRRWEMGDALNGARDAMNEALEFCVRLRRMQMRILVSYDLDLGFSSVTLGNSLSGEI